MVRSYIFFISIIICFFSCNEKIYKLSYDNNGEPIVEEGMYTFNKKMDNQDFQIIDTSKMYLQVFNNRDSNELEQNNPNVIFFSSDGYFKMNSKKFIGKFDKQRTKISAYYGGRFYIENDIIFFESFYPSKGGKTYNYIKLVKYGKVKGDTLFIENKEKKETYIKVEKFQDN